MKLVEINWSPSESQLRQFGVLCAVVSPLLGWLWSFGESGIAVLLVTGLIIAVLSFVWPQPVKVIFLGLTLAVAPIGFLLGELAMLLIFIGVFLPIGLMFRMIGRDALKLKINKRAGTYWQPKPEPNKVSDYYRRY